MSEFSAVLANENINLWLRNTAISIPQGSAFASLHSAAGAGGSESNAAWALTELANANGYVRKAVTFLDPASTPGLTNNTIAVTFGPATPAGWVSATHLGLWTSVTYGAGNLLFYTPITAVTVNLNEQVTFAETIGITVTIA